MSYPITLRIPGIRYSARGLALAIFACLATSAHLEISRTTIDYRGWLAILDRGFDLILTVALLVIAYSLGRCMSRALKLDFISRMEEAAYSMMLGVGVIGLGILGLGLIGWLRPPQVIILFLIFCFIAHRDIRYVSVLTREQYRPADWLSWVLVCSVIVLTGWLLVQTQTPPYSPDEVIYHLPVMQAFVERGRVYPVLDNFSGNLPFLVQMLYSVCLIMKSDIAAKLLSLSLSLVGAIGMSSFCARFLSRKAGWLAFLGFFASGMTTEISITTRVDVTLAGMLFLTTSAMMIFIAKGNRGWLIASALLAGFSLGIKYTAAQWLVMLGVMFCVESWRKGDLFSTILRNGALFIIITLAIASPWILKNVVWFHNPIYPFFTGEVVGLEGGRPLYFTNDDEKRIEHHVNHSREKFPDIVYRIEQTLSNSAAWRPERMPWKFWEYWTSPLKYIVADPGLTPNYLFVFLPFLFLTKPEKWILWLLGLSLGFFLLMAQASWLARYLLPLYPPLTIASAYALHSMGEILKRRFRLGEWFPLLIVVSALCLALYPSGRQYWSSNGPGFLLGRLSRRDFLLAARGDYKALNFLDNLSPADGKALMIGAQMNYGLQRPHISDAGWNSVEWRRLLSRYESFDEVHKALKERGVQYVMYYPNLFLFVAYTGSKGSGPSGDIKLAFNSENDGRPDYNAQLQNWATFEAYSRLYLDQIYGNDGMLGFKIYRLR